MAMRSASACVRIAAHAIAVLGGVLFCVIAAPVSAQPTPDIDGFWTVRFESPAAARGLVDRLPPGAVMIDDAGGGELEAGDFAGLRLSDRAREQIANYDPLDELLRENTCVAPSVVFYMQAPFPMEIHQGRDLIVFRMEYFDMFRVVFLDGRARPPADAPHTRSGFSLGRWEGGTLHVETTHIAAGTFMNNGFDHSPNIRMQEQLWLSEDGRTLHLVQSYEDPETFQGIAARYMAWNRVPGEYVYPYDCDPSFGQ
jgi:hypothetical protein